MTAPQRPLAIELHGPSSALRDAQRHAKWGPWLGRARVDPAWLVVDRPQTIQNAPVVAGLDRFLIAKNPDDASSLKKLDMWSRRGMIDA